MTPFVSYEYMVANGYLDDNVHPGNACYIEMADQLWRELGFFALRVDRRLAIEQSAHGIVATWPTAEHIRYMLDASTNLTDWVPLATHAGDGAAASYTNEAPQAASTIYRVRLAPE
jgi:hypothetical protein